MERGLYIAATGMMSDVVRQDTIASNLANVNTVGYKEDRVVNETFTDLFLHNVQNGRNIGPLNMGTRVAATVTDFSQGPLRNTGNALDLAIGGDGFFTVQTPQGVRYSRDGEFSRDAQGFLVDGRGNSVLSATGQRIQVGQGDPVISVDGSIFDSQGSPLGRIGIVTLDVGGAGSTARKAGDNYWTGRVTGGFPPRTAVRQGFIEQSGVNSVKEMVEMITTLRSYESAQKAVTAIDGTLDKAVNSVGNL